MSSWVTNACSHLEPSQRARALEESSTGVTRFRLASDNSVEDAMKRIAKSIRLRTHSLFIIRYYLGDLKIMTVMIVNNDLRHGWKAQQSQEQLARAVENNSNEESMTINFGEVFRFTTKLDDFSSIVLSGSVASLRVGEDEPRISRLFRDEIELVKRSDVPILGICYGHQLIGHSFGSRIHKLEGLIEGFQNVKILEVDPLFSNWRKGEVITVREEHVDHLSELPKNFVALAASQFCGVEAMKHVSKPIYGVQFHPETCFDQDTGQEYPDGWTVLKNFFSYMRHRNASRAS